MYQLQYGSSVRPATLINEAIKIVSLNFADYDIVKSVELTDITDQEDFINVTAKVTWNDVIDCNSSTDHVEEVNFDYYPHYKESI